MSNKDWEEAGVINNQPQTYRPLTHQIIRELQYFHLCSRFSSETPTLDILLAKD